MATMAGPQRRSPRVRRGTGQAGSALTWWLRSHAGPIAAVLSAAVSAMAMAATRR